MPYGWCEDPISMLNDLRRVQLASTRKGQHRNVAGVYSAVSIYDDGATFMIRAELPGPVKSKLDIATKGTWVSIAGERTCARRSPSRFSSGAELALVPGSAA